jgi:hypothetical protein
VTQRVSAKHILYEEEGVLERERERERNRERRDRERENEPERAQERERGCVGSKRVYTQADTGKPQENVYFCLALKKQLRGNKDELGHNRCI